MENRPSSDSPEFGPEGKDLVDDYLTSAAVVTLRNHPIFYKVWFWLLISAVIYTAFEITNFLNSCSLAANVAVGLLGFFGFSALIGAVIATILEMLITKKFSSWAVVIVLFAVALTLADRLFGTACYY